MLRNIIIGNKQNDNVRNDWCYEIEYEITIATSVSNSYNFRMYDAYISNKNFYSIEISLLRDVTKNWEKKPR